MISSSFCFTVADVLDLLWNGGLRHDPRGNMHFLSLSQKHHMRWRGNLQVGFLRPSVFSTHRNPSHSPDLGSPLDPSLLSTRQGLKNCVGEAIVAFLGAASFPSKTEGLRSERFCFKLPELRSDFLPAVSN